MTCPLCASRETQMEHLHREILELRLALANSEPTVSARRDLAIVNERLVEANQKIAGLKARLDRKKAS